MKRNVWLKLIDWPETDVGMQRRRETHNLTTLEGCGSFNEWMRQCSQLGDRWRDEHSWRLVRKILLSDTGDPLIEACGHLLALRGPYVAATPIPGNGIGAQGTLSSLFSGSERLKVERGDCTAEEVFRARSLLRRGFISGLVRQALRYTWPGDQIRELGGNEGPYRPTAPLRALTDALMDQIKAQIASMSTLDWERDAASSEVLQQNQTSGRVHPSHEGGLIDDASIRQQIVLPASSDEPPASNPAPNAATGDAHDIFRERSHESIEILYRLARDAEEFTYVLLAHRRALRLLPYFSQQSELRLSIEQGVLSPGCMTANLYLYRPLFKSYRSLLHTFDGRVLLRAVPREITRLLAHWPYLRGDGEYECAIATARDTATQEILLAKRSNHDIADLVFFWYRANGTERYPYGNVLVNDPVEITDDRDLLDFYASLLELFPEDLLPMSRLKRNADLNLTKKLQKIQAETFPGNVEHENALVRALRDGLVFWETYAPAWVEPVYKQADLAQHVEFDYIDYRL